MTSLMALLVFSIMSDFSKLRNIYWSIRYARYATAKRRYYRHAAKEKKRLLEAGVDPEELRLLCRHLANLRNRHAEKRLEAYCRKRAAIL